MAFTKNNTKKIGRPSKNMQKDRLRQEFESVIRTGGRVKKAKKVFDPSENNPPKRRARNQSNIDPERPKSNNDATEITNNSSTKPHTKHYKKRKLASKVQDDFCSVCSKKSANLIICQDCNLKVHQSCMNTNFKNSKLLEVKWRCDSCKTCSMCYENAETGPLITCIVCIKSYHYSCHVPKLFAENNTNWMCTKCSPKPSQFKPAILKSRRNTISATLTREIISASSKYEESENGKIINLQSNNNINFDNKFTNITNVYEDDDDDDDYDDDDDEEYDNDENTEINKNNNHEKLNKMNKVRFAGDVPDVSKWSCDQLASFVKKYFPGEAKHLRDQEIDGASLLLLSRSDVINGLKLKLGPAIRLYNFITILQTKKIDVTAAWIY